MGLLHSSSALAYLRSRNDADLLDVCDIFEKTEADENGGYKASWDIEAMAVPCRFAPLDLRVPVEASIAEQLGPAAKWIVIFATGTSVPNSRRLLVTVTEDGMECVKPLAVLGELIKRDSILHRVVCADLPGFDPLPELP